MADLIDRQALLAEMRRSGKAAYIVVQDAPAVDAVEVVRCKGCKHWLKDFAGCTDNVGRCEWANYMIGAAGYCVYGERRADNAPD